MASGVVKMLHPMSERIIAQFKTIFHQNSVTCLTKKCPRRHLVSAWGEPGYGFSHIITGIDLVF